MIQHLAVALTLEKKYRPLVTKMFIKICKRVY